MKDKDITKEVLEKIVSESITITEVGLKLGAPSKSAAFKRAKKFATKLGVTLPADGISKANTGENSANYVPDSELFIKGRRAKGPYLKARMLKKGVIDECSIEECFVTNVWEGKPLELEVDHINGDSLDNTFDNLRLLCPNCHLQTDTHSNKTR